MTVKEDVIKINNDIKIVGDLCGKNYTRDDYDNCECGKRKLRTDVFCKECGKDTENKFIKLFRDNLDEYEIKHIDATIEGYSLEDYLKKEGM